MGGVSVVCVQFEASKKRSGSVPAVQEISPKNYAAYIKRGLPGQRVSGGAGKRPFTDQCPSKARLPCLKFIDVFIFFSDSGSNSLFVLCLKRTPNLCV